MNVKRGFLFTVIVLVILISLAIVYLWSSLNEIVEAAIEKYGTQITQTSVNVKGVDIKLTEGSGAISGITISSPTGFVEPYALSLGQIRTSLDINTLADDTIVIKEIVVNAPKVFYEINKSGSGNINELKNNIVSSSPSGTTENSKEDQTAGGQEKKMIIRRFVIADGELNARIAALKDKTIKAKLPRIEMKNIGEKQGGATGAEIAKVVLSKLTKYATDEVKKMGLEQYLGKSLEDLELEAKKELQKKANERVDKELQNILGDKDKEELEHSKDTLKKLFNK